MTERASRYNEGKRRWNLLPLECIEELITILEKGAIKYADENWKQSINTSDHSKFVKDRIESIYRHLAEIRRGSVYDQEKLLPDSKRHTGVHYTEKELNDFNSRITTHAGAIAVNALFIFVYQMSAIE